MVVSGVLILALPVVLGANALWLAMPITELLVAIYTVCGHEKIYKDPACRRGPALRLSIKWQDLR